MGSLKRFMMALALWIGKHPLTMVAVFAWASFILVSGYFFIKQQPVTSEILQNDVPSKKTTNFGYIKYDSTPDKRPLFEISVENLQSVSSKVGVLRTGLANVINIQKLFIISYEYPPRVSASDCSQTAPMETYKREYFSALKDTATLEKISELLYANDIDTKTIVGIRSREFSYELLNGDVEVLRINSTIAEIKSTEGLINLHGYTSISTPNKKLECGNASWNAKDNSFLIRGKYSLLVNGRRTVAADGTFDSKLNSIKNEQPKGI